jgi:Domain of unknown function (DUF4232)
MPISLHAVRRGMVAVAASCAAVLSMTAASAAVHHSAGFGGTPPCMASRLRLSLGQGSGAAGSVTYPLRFTNVRLGACHLFGYPGVSAVGRRGKQLGSPAGRNTLYRRGFVTLRRGQTAHVLLTITVVQNFPSRICRVVTAAGLRVYPPARRLAGFLPFRFSACSRSGPVYLRVTAVRAGRGSAMARR